MKATAQNNLQQTATEVYCNGCKSKFSLKAVGIKETEVQCGNASCTLMYFACPQCHHIYRICLQDAKYRELAEDLETTKKRIRRSNGRMDVGLAERLDGMARRKAERLAAHVANLSRKYPGTFVFAVPESGKGEIVYRE